MNKRLFVGGIPWATTDAELNEAFGKAGKVVSAEIRRDPVTGRSKGYAFVEMETEDEAKNAIDMFNEKEFGGRNLTVNEARPKRQDAGGDFRQAA